MKKSIINSVVFNPIAKTIDTGILDFDIRNLYAIINQTTQQIIYATSKVGYGFDSVSNSVVTLEFNTASMTSTDVLQIIYDDSEDIEVAQALYEVAERLSFLAGVKGVLADLRVTPTGTVTITGTISTVTTVTTVNTVTTVATLTNQTNIGGYSAAPQIQNLMNLLAVQGNINNIA